MKERQLGWNQLGGYCNRRGERENESELMHFNSEIEMGLERDAVGLEKEETCEIDVEWFRLPTDRV